MANYIQTIVLRRSQWAPVFIPVPDTLRVHKKSSANTWREIDRVDINDSSSADTYSYDGEITSILFHPTFVGGTVRVEYTHNNVPNPGTLDLLPTLLAEQARSDYNRVNGGLHILREYVDGQYTGWSGRNMVVSSGMVSLFGDLYSVGRSTWDLNRLGGQAGENIVTVSMLYISHDEISTVQATTRLIAAPKVFISGRYLVGDGGGVSSALTEINQFISDNSGGLGFVELMRVVVESQKEPLPPNITIWYEPSFRSYQMV